MNPDSMAYRLGRLKPAPTLGFMSYDLEKMRSRIDVVSRNDTFVTRGTNRFA